MDAPSGGERRLREGVGLFLMNVEKELLSP